MIFLHTDGGSRGNPGLAAIGVVIYDKDYKEVESFSQRIDDTTNSVAEYKALIKGLELAKKYDNEISVHMDSEFIIKQMNGEYRVKTEHIIPLFNEVQKMKANLKVTFTHVPRENIFQSRADQLVNQALDN